ncbi:unannotated protein [freshwater metagenome]|uniref:Unannotated protein n=1 Tax=freshwater metagenome TaxID=449393 RepID=A0A6J7NF38_9ZZZZ
MVIGNRTASHKCGDNGNIKKFGQSEERFRRARFENAAAGVENWALRCVDQPSGIFDERRVAIEPWVVTRKIDRIGPIPIERRIRIGGIDEIFRNVDKHRPGSASGCDVERLANDAGDVRCIRHELVVLRDRTRNADRVDFLERIGTNAGRTDLPGDDNHRDRVHIRVGKRRDDVGRCGTTRDHCDARTTCCMRIALGHVSCALFMTNKDVTDR